MAAPLRLRVWPGLVGAIFRLATLLVLEMALEPTSNALLPEPAEPKSVVATGAMPLPP